MRGEREAAAMPMNQADGETGEVTAMIARLRMNEGGGEDTNTCRH